MRLLIATLLIVVGGAGPAGQQQQSRESIPKDLVLLLMRGAIMPDDDFDIVLGLPAGFPSELLPRGAKPLISTTTKTNMTVIAQAGNEALDVAAYDRQLASAGWSTSPRSGAQTRGLLAGAPPQLPGMWCRADKYASIWASPRPEGGSIVRVAVSDTSRGNPCSPMGPQTFNSIQTDVDLPLLFPPPQSRATGTGMSGGGSSDSYDQRLRLETRLTTPEVLQHYRAQLEAHGWKFQSQAVGDGVGIVRFAVVSVKKEPVTATLSVVVVPGEPPLEVTLRILRAPYRPFVP